MDCLVTGASGYIGRPLVDALAGAGWRVRAQVHRGVAPENAERVLRISLTEGDGRDLRAALTGVDTVFHLAAIAHRHATEADYQRINRDATLALADHCLDAGVRRLVFVSSVKADSASAERTPYGRSKADAEAMLQDRLASSAMDWVIVRPALVYDRDTVGYLRLLQRWSALGLPMPPAGGARSMISRGDLVRLLVHLGAAEMPRGQILVCTDGERYSARRLCAAFRAAAGRRLNLPSPPAVAWRLACAGVDRLRRRPAGETWERLLGEELHPASDLASLCAFRTRDTVECVMGAGVLR